MTIEDKIKNEKLKYDINREAAKISALSSGKIDKYEYLTGEEILPPNQQQIIEQAKFTYSPLEKLLKKKQTIEDQEKKQVDALESLKTSDKELPPIKDFVPIENLNIETINEIKTIEEEEIREIKRNKMAYKSTNKTYDFKNFKTIRAFGSQIRNNAIDMDTANVDQMNLTQYIKDFANTTKPRNPELKELKKDVLNSALALLEGRDMLYKEFESRIFLSSEESLQEGEGLKTLTPNQMLKRLPIALAQLKAGNNSESLLNKIRQIVYSLYRSKKITKKIYNNIIKSIKV